MNIVKNEKLNYLQTVEIDIEGYQVEVCSDV